MSVPVFSFARVIDAFAIFFSVTALAAIFADFTAFLARFLVFTALLAMSWDFTALRAMFFDWTAFLPSCDAAMTAPPLTARNRASVATTFA